MSPPFVEKQFLFMQYLDMIPKAETAFKCFFLIYFVFYAVSPLSSALSREPSSHVSQRQGISPDDAFSLLEASVSFAEPSGIKEQINVHVDPLIFDMALWGILKKGKPSDDAGGSKFVAHKAGSKNLPEAMKCGIFGAVSIRTLPFYDIASQGLENQPSYYLNTPLLYSGLSPPSA